MKSFKSMLAESLSAESQANRDSSHNKVARQRFENVQGLARTIGTHSGTHMKHTSVRQSVGKELWGTHPVNGDRGHHEYAFKSDPLNRGDDGAYYGHVKFKEGTSIEGVGEAIAKANPHLKNTGHGLSLHNSIIELHKQSNQPLYSREDSHYHGHENT